MFEYLRKFFDTSDFPARWHCGNWTEFHGWLHVTSDVLIWAAYMAIPLALLFFARRRTEDLLFPRVVFLFVAFIAACGTAHLVEAIIFWWPAYRVSGALKLITAIVSWLTVIALIRIAPFALEVPGIVKMNTELRRRNQELDEYAHVVSHDLRAPLRGIATLAEWIAEDNADKLEGESREQLDLLVERVTKMGALVDGILEYSRVGRVRTSFETVDSGLVAAEVVDLLAPPPGIEVTLDPGLPVVHIDPRHLAQVLQNLIGNAVQHMGAPTGEIGVTCHEDARGWEFCVRDTGVGIAPEHHERIFRIFERLRQDDANTSGLGLAIVTKIVEQYGGTVRVESEVGVGSRFYFQLPKVSVGTGRGARRGSSRVPERA